MSCATGFASQGLIWRLSPLRQVASLVTEGGEDFGLVHGALYAGIGPWC